jgi:hypothetical protein
MFANSGSTTFTAAGAASVAVFWGAIGQFELSMSTVCCARTPGGVFVLIVTPPSVAAVGVLGAEQLPQISAVTMATTTMTADWYRIRRWCSTELGKAHLCSGDQGSTITVIGGYLRCFFSPGLSE